MPRDQRSRKFCVLECLNFGEAVEQVGPSSIMGLQEVMLSRVESGQGSSNLRGWVRDSILYSSKVETPLLIRDSPLLHGNRIRSAIHDEGYGILPILEAKEWDAHYSKATQEIKSKVPFSKRSGFLLDPEGKINITSGNNILLDFWLGPELAQKYFSFHKESRMTQRHRPIRFSYPCSDRINGQDFVIQQVYCGGSSVNWDISAGCNDLADRCTVLAHPTD